MYEQPAGITARNEAASQARRPRGPRAVTVRSIATIMLRNPPGRGNRSPAAAVESAERGSRPVW